MVTPYEYQREAVAALNESFETGNRALLVAPPGIGKTLKAAFWAAQHVGNGRGLFLCHENRILEQALQEFRQVMGEGISLGVFHGERKDFDKVDICFASFQTFRRWKDAFFPDEFLFIIVDEGHHAAAPTFRPVVEYFTPRYLLGMTATPDRADDQDIRGIFGPEVVNISLEEAISKGWLTPFEYYVVTDNLRQSTLRRLIKEEFGEERRVSLKQLNESIFVTQRDEQVAERILRLNKKTIIFCERIEHAEHFAEFIPGSKPYHTGRGHKENRETLQAFRSGELQYILAVDKLNEGVDIPDAEVIVFFRNTDSERIFLQQLGRGARRRPGKEKYIVLDFVANIHRLLALREMVETIERAQGGERPEFDTSLIHLSGQGFDFRFTAEQLSVFEIVERMKPKFISDFPELVREYSDRNPLPSEMVRAQANLALWWKCSACGYEWQTSGYCRAYQGTGCPACINRVATPTNNLTVTHPELAKEYSDKNELPADKVIAGTGRKLWWKCSVCGHEWQTTGNRRVQGSGCSVCSRRRQGRPLYARSLAVTHPELAKEYSDRNEIPADEVSAWTDKLLWWKCSTCGHEWQTSGHMRAGGVGCPGCSGHVVTSTNNLTVTHPQLAKEYSARNTLPAEQVRAGTNKKLWWKCASCGHEWQAPGNRRVRGSGCPACAGFVPTTVNNMAATHPELAKEYADRNELPAHQVIAGTAKKVWWRCLVCGYEWQATGHHRVSGTGCPACAGRVVTSTNNLAFICPGLVAEYSERNEFPPEEVYSGTHKKLWWKCSTCGHEWQAPGSRRVGGSGCPACPGRTVTAANNLAAVHPGLAREYSSRNRLPASGVYAHTQKKLWWRCSQCDHEWSTTPYARVYAGAGCPVCARVKYNAPELLQQIRDLADELGKIPTGREMDTACKEGRCANSATFRKYFGSVPAARKAAGLEK